MGSVIVPKLITGPTSPVSLEEAKVYLRIDDEGSSPGIEDDLISGIIAAAVSYLDGPSGILRHSVLPTTWEIALDEFPESEIRLPLPLLQSVTSVKYTDADGDEQTVAVENYESDTYSTEGWIVPVSGYSWPSPMETINAVRVRWVAGLATCPPEVKAAAYLMIGHLYGHRGDGDADIPPAVDILLHTRKRIVFA
jgi:uncharacterized phiE125 gp8 family phage protein